MIMTSKEAIAAKRAAIERFVWAYLQAQERLAQSPQQFAAAYAELSGMQPDIAAKASQVIKLGEVISPDQIKRQAKAFADLGVIQKDVSGQIDANWDGSFVKEALAK
jgi:sulfonate transport system substrate-binding protein